MLNTLREALFRHGSVSKEAGLEAYCVAVAIREVNPPQDCLPVIIQHLPELARQSSEGRQHPVAIRGQAVTRLSQQVQGMLDLAHTMRYDLQQALSAVGRADAPLDDLTPADLWAVAGQFRDQQTRRDQQVILSFRQLEDIDPG